MTTAPVTISKPSYVQALRCRECGNDYPKTAIHVCEFCFGPLEVAYDYAAIGKVLTRALIESRAPTMWRYAELLPLDGPPSRCRSAARAASPRRRETGARARAPATPP